MCLEKEDGDWKVESSICVKIHGVSFFFGEVCACFRVLDVIDDVLIFACCFFRILAKSYVFFRDWAGNTSFLKTPPKKNPDEFPMLPLWIFTGSMGLVYLPTFWLKSMVFFYVYGTYTVPVPWDPLVMGIWEKSPLEDGICLIPPWNVRGVVVEFFRR